MNEGKAGAKACGAAEPGQAKARRPDAGGGPKASAIEARKGRDAAGGSVHESAVRPKAGDALHPRSHEVMKSEPRYLYWQRCRK